MPVDHTNGDPVHVPKRRNVFQFDDEVASIFDNMAPRSIPMYDEAHRLHVSLLRGWLTPGAVIADIGSSTGHLFRNVGRLLCKQFHETGIEGIALDSSYAMMDRLRAEFPTVDAIVADLARADPLLVRVDVMFALYVLQFIEPEMKCAALDWLVENTKIGGVIVLGQKEEIAHPWANGMFADEYYRFRHDNGYSQEEIDAKTEALKNSMWPITSDELVSRLNMRGVEVYETSRWLQFSTLIGVRRR